MPKYRKIPLTIEAIKFTDENKDQVFSWARSLQYSVYSSFENGKPCLIIPTMVGEMTCSLGDYLIVKPFPTDWQKLYPCKPDIFERTYEPLEDVTISELNQFSQNNHQ